MVKVSVGSIKKKEIVVDMPDIEVTQVGNTTNMLLKYNWHLDSTDNKIAVNLKLQSVKNYWRRVAQVVDEFNHFHDFLLAFIMFINKAYGNYD